MNADNTARRWVPDEIVPEPKPEYALKASLRLIRHGKIEGWVDAMMSSGPIPFDEAQRLTWEARHRARAEQRYPELGR